MSTKHDSKIQKSSQNAECKIDVFDVIPEWFQIWKGQTDLSRPSDELIATSP